MESKHQTIQTVLLIDSFNPGTLSERDLSKKNKAIALTSFRVLTHLQSSITSDDSRSKARSDTGLKWSYKFFNSRSYKSSTKQDKFRDFKLRYFEQYESKLEETIQTTKEKIAKTSKLYPAECLQKALTEIVTDLEWEIPDITSPMKGRRHVKQQPRPSGNQNAVFLFSNLPCNPQEMRMFAGKRVLDADILLDAIMPPHLFEQFRNNSKISLYWIDITSLNFLQPEDETMNLADVKCIEIISHTLNRIKGSALKIETVINMVHSDVKMCKESAAEKSEICIDKKKQERNVCDKPKLCLNFLPINFPSDAIVKNMKPVRLKSGTDQKENLHQNCSLNFGNGSSIEKISLKCVPICIPNISPPGQCTTSGTSLVKLQQRNGDDNPEAVTITKPQELKNLLNDELDFTVHSFMSKSTQHFQSLTGTISFSVSLPGQGEITHAQAFEELLRNLNERNNFLVLTVKSSSGQPCPVLALMEVLTSHSGVISLLPLGATLKLEKACLSETERSSSSTETKSCEGSSTLERLSTVCKQKSSSLRSKLSSRSPRRKHKNVTAGYNPQVLNSWHLPGTSRGLSSLISKLNNRLEDLTFLSPEEKQSLKRLQKMYRKENQPPALQQNSGQHSLNSHTQPEDKASEETQPSVEVGKRKNSKLNRGLLMVSRSKAAVKRHSKTEEEIEASQAEKTSNKLHVDVTNLDLLSEESLCVYVRDVYSTSVDRGEGLETAVQNMVTVTVHFLKDKGDNPEVQAVELLRRELVISNSALREKYQEKTTDLDKSMKITEYKLQVLLLLEMESAVLSADDSHIDKCADEIVGLLRTLSFITDSGFVPNFLNKDILTSYSSTLPRLLVTVYDELMQPLPESLAMFASPNKSADSSVLDTSLHSVDSLQDPGSSKSDILQSNRTLRNRKLVQHPSLSDYGSKKRIMVMNKPAAKTKDKAKEKEKLKRQKSAQPTTKPKKNKGKEDIVKVRRNLFEGDKPKLERRQSVAVMERTRKSPYKRNMDLSFKSPKATKSPGAKRRSVAETPAHKQKWNAVWNRQEKKRKRTATEEDVEVVQESPMKQEHLVEASPSRNKHAVNMMRRSFYSAGPRSRSRNLTKYFQFADKIAGRQQRLSVGDAPGSQPRLPLPHKSPSRSSFLMSQLMGSPSPRHKTPSKSSRSATTTTPKRLVEESPYRKTRSKTPKKFSKILSFDSPKRSNHGKEEMRKVINSPSKHHRTPKKNQEQNNVLCAESPGPLTRSRTPSKIKSSPQPAQDQNPFPVSSQDIRIPSTPKCTHHHPTSTPLLQSPCLAPPLTPQRSILKNSHSSTKHTELPSTPQRTPKADRLLSEPERLVSESPCHNTRSRNSTPSRTSVCTALFMKSPRGTPRSKLFSEIETRSPKRRVHFDNVEETGSQENGDSDVDRQILQQKPVESVTNLSFKNKDGSVTSLSMKSSPTSSQKPSDVQKTPSPRKTQKVTTPESFDKWPRRKRRWASPTQPSAQKENLNIREVNSNSDLTCNTKLDSYNSSNDNSQELKRRVISRKRSFHESVQDLDTVYSSNKRSKTSWTDSLSSQDALDTRYCLHRRVTSTVSNSGDLPSSLTSSLTSSQTSGVEMDYFSATNDEVFLTSDSQNTDSQSQESSSSLIQSVRCQSTRRAESPVFGTSPSVSRLLQASATEQSPSSQGFDICTEDEPQSPTFKTSPVLNKLNKSTKTVSPKSKPVSGKTKTDFVSPSRVPVFENQSKTPPLQKSPKGRSVASSPVDKKFSPSVSARSLVHLMNSPLIQPDGSAFHSPDRMDNLAGRSHFKSRKSLNMQH